MKCPRCGAPEAEVVRCIELPPDARSDEITVFVERCPTCEHPFFATYEESRRGALGEDHWNAHAIACTATAWARLDALIARCPNPRTASCDCVAHRELGRCDRNGHWSGLGRYTEAAPGPAPKQPRHVPTRRTSGVTAPSPTGDRIAIGGKRGDVEIVDAETGERLASHRVFDADTPLRALAWSPDGEHLACGASGADALRVIVADTGAVAWQRDHEQVHFSASGDPWGFPDEQRHAEVYGLAFSPDGRALVCGGEGEHVTLWSAQGEPTGSMPVDGWTSIAAVAVSPDGQRVAAVDRRGALRVALIERPQEPRVCAVGIDGPKAVCFSPDGRRVTVRGADRQVRVVDVDARPDA